MAGRVALRELLAWGAGLEIMPPRSLASARRLVVHVLLLIVLAFPCAAAEPVKGTVSATVENGFARLVFFLGNDLESKVQFANNIIIINFDRPVDVSVERLQENSGGYISASRRDPDGKAVRIAVARTVTVNSMAAGERLFVDLLPESWTGLPPGLPREVIEDLARRAHEADKKARQERPADGGAKIALIRVRVANLPTLTRYTFELPQPIGVAAESGKDKLTLNFSAALKFDLADAQANLPRMIHAIDSELNQDTAVVRFAFGSKVDIRTFREDNNYMVDVSSVEATQSRKKDTKPADKLAALASDLMMKKTPPDDVQPPQSIPAKEHAQTAAPPSAEAAQEAQAPITPAASAPAQRAAQQRQEGARAIAPDQEASAPAIAPAAAEGRNGPAAMPAMAPVASDPSDSERAPRPEAEARAAGSTVKVQMTAQDDGITLRLPFASPTPGAVFRRADTLWLVFDTDSDIEIAAMPDDPSHNIEHTTVMRRRNVSVIRMKLERPRLTSVSAEGTTWVVNLGTQSTAALRPLAIERDRLTGSLASATIMLAGAGAVHQFEDPDAAESLFVVTALPPVRGFVSDQEFVEFNVLATAHGVVIEPLADDLDVELAADRVMLTRPRGLTVSVPTFDAPGDAPDEERGIIDPQIWARDHVEAFDKGESQLMFSAARAPESQRLAARVDLARFYIAWEMSAEAKGVLDVALKDNPSTKDDPMPLVLRAVANIMLGHPQDALKDLANPAVGNQFDAPLWRALAYARMGRWTEAHDGFQDPEASMATLPLSLQQQAMREAVRSAVEVGDTTGAVNSLHQFEALGIPREFEPSMLVVNGKLAERLGHVSDALQSYQSAADSWDRPAAAQGQLREIELEHSIGKLKRADAIGDLETLTTVWRGDDTEIEALKLLAHLYTLEGRYRDAFHVMRAALMAHPNSEMTRAIQEEAATTFENLFLAGRGDKLPAIDALALFYDFRELTPIGRRGDEMIRRISDRLVAVDLLDQAADLLQYQVDNRLQGAARAQVASRLAVVYLMNHKPDQALATLRTTQLQDLSNELRQQRLLLEARALSDTGRNDVAIEVIANIESPEATRLRADILWAAKRWQAAAEQIELLYGDRWKDFAPLNDLDRSDILRAAAGYALGQDRLGLARFRERYAGKMGDGPDRRIFDVLTAPTDTGIGDFRAMAHSIAAVDTLDGFLRDLRARFPETGPLPAKPAGQPALATTQASLTPPAPNPAISAATSAATR